MASYNSCGNLQKNDQLTRVCLFGFVFYATVYKPTCALRQIATHGVAPRNVTLAVRYLRKHADGHTCELIAVCHFGHVKLASPASQSASVSVKWQSLPPQLNRYHSAVGRGGAGGGCGAPGIDGRSGRTAFAQEFKRVRVKRCFQVRKLGFVGRVVRRRADFERVLKVCRIPESVCNVVRSAERET